MGKWVWVWVLADRASLTNALAARVGCGLPASLVACFVEARFLGKSLVIVIVLLCWRKAVG